MATGDHFKEGRPLKFNNCLDLQMQVELYLDNCEEKRRPLTMSGLANAIGIDRKTLLNYSKKEEFFPTIKKYKSMVEQFLEESLFGTGVAGVIFNLKNNFEWKDKQEIDQTNTTVTVNAPPPKPE